jgi:hypothetical protein
VNTTLMVQLDLAARLVVQVVADTLKSPVVEIAMPVSATLCLLASVNTFAGLLVPTFSAGNVLLVGVNVACTVPVPDSATVCGLLGELSVSVKVPVRVPTWVGVKVTSILQLLPAASVLPQGFVLVVWPKSPLVAMLLMFSVEVPVLVSVTAFAALVTPTTVLANVRDVGDTVTVGPLLLVLTVRLSVVVFDNVPETPPMVTVTVPVAAVALAVKVSVLVVVAGLGLKPAVTPLGKPEAERVTLPLKPFCGVMVIVLVPLLPCVMVTLFGLAESVKFGAPPGQLFTRLAAFTVPIPVAKSHPVVVP